MKTGFAWCFGSCLVLVSSILLIQNLRLTKQVARLRAEKEKAEFPTSAKEDSNTSKVDWEELDRLRKNNSELIRLRNEFGLLQSKIKDLHQQNLDLLRAKQEQAEVQKQSRSFDPASEEKIRSEIRKEAITTLDEQLTNQQHKLDEAKSALIELSKTLDVPDGISKVEASEGLKNPKLQAFWPYFEAQRDCEMSRRIVEIIKLKLASEKAELETAKDKN